jgi:hypothetical protein
MENKNLEIWNNVKIVPQEYQKKITGGRLKGMTDIKPQWRLMVLTEQFGMCGVGWYYETAEKWIHQFDSTISAHVIIKLYIKDGDNWSKGIEGQGGSMLVAKESKGPFHSDEAYKMATTDALSVACKQLGIASDVYMGIDSTKYQTKEETDKEKIAKLKVSISTGYDACKSKGYVFTEPKESFLSDDLKTLLDNYKTISEYYTIAVASKKVVVGG